MDEYDMEMMAYEICNNCGGQVARPLPVELKNYPSGLPGKDRAIDRNQKHDFKLSSAENIQAELDTEEQAARRFYFTKVNA